MPEASAQTGARSQQMSKATKMSRGMMMPTARPAR
jgi:hypothetical protein